MYKIYEDEFGSLSITEQTVSAIAAVAATDVEGVAGMSSTLVDGVAKNVLGINSLSRGVKTEIDEGNVTISLYIIVRHGYRIPDIALRVQEKVKSIVESLTDYTVVGVNLFVQGIIFDK